MKKLSEKRQRVLEDIEFEALASFLWCDVDLVESIYKSYGYDGLAIILISNVTLMYNKTLIGKELLLRNLAKQYCDKKGNEIVSLLFGNRFFYHKDGIYYSKCQFEAFGHNRKPTKEKLLEAKNVKFIIPNWNVFNKNKLNALFDNVCDEVKGYLPDYIIDEIKGNNIQLYDIKPENFYRLLLVFLKHEPHNITFKRLLLIQLRVLHKDADELFKIVDNSRVLKFIEHDSVIYCPQLRIENLYNENPSIEEIKNLRNKQIDNYLTTLYNLITLNLK